MPLSTYDVTVSNYFRLFGALSAILDKAAAHAAAGKIEPAAFITARLYPNMWSFGEQVAAACSQAVRGTSRLAGVPIKSYEGPSATFEDLKARIAWTMEHLRSLDRAAFDGAEDRTIVYPAGGSEVHQSGKDYLLQFSLPNVYFHLTTAYNILRHNGLPLAKEDFLGG